MPSPPDPGPRALKIAPSDNVGTAVDAIAAGQRVIVLCDGSPATGVLATDPIPLAHKIAQAPIARGSAVLKYGAGIGQATADIPVGGHVHVHNLRSLRGRNDID